MAKMNDEEFKKAVEKLFKEENEKAVTDLQEALHLDQALNLIVKYLNNGFLNEEMPLMEVLEKLEKKKFELIGMDPEEIENDEEED